MCVSFSLVRPLLFVQCPHGGGVRGATSVAQSSQRPYLLPPWPPAGQQLHRTTQCYTTGCFTFGRRACNSLESAVCKPCPYMVTVVECFSPSCAELVKVRTWKWWGVFLEKKLLLQQLAVTWGPPQVGPRSKAHIHVWPNSTTQMQMTLDELEGYSPTLVNVDHIFFPNVFFFCMSMPAMFSFTLAEVPCPLSLPVHHVPYTNLMSPLSLAEQARLGFLHVPLVTRTTAIQLASHIAICQCDCRILINFPPSALQLSIDKNPDH